MSLRGAVTVMLVTAAVAAAAVLAAALGCERPSLSWVLKEPIGESPTAVPTRGPLTAAMVAQGKGAEVVAECGHDLCHRKPSIFRLCEGYPVLAESYLVIEIARLPRPGETCTVQEARLSGSWATFGPGRFVQLVDLKASRGTVSWDGTTMTVSLEYEGALPWYVSQRKGTSWRPGSPSRRARLSFHLETRCSTGVAHRLRQWRQEALQEYGLHLPAAVP